MHRSATTRILISTARLFWLFVLCAHAAVAVLWWWIMPGGFPPGHVRFFANQIAPLVVVGGCIFGLRALRENKSRSLGVVLLMFAVAWLAAAIAGRVIFPVGARVLWIPCAAVGLVFAAGSYAAGREESFPLQWVLLTPIVAAFGVFLPLSQRSGPADTHPINEAPPEVESNASAEPPKVVALGDAAEVRTSDGTVSLRCGRVFVDFYPFLVFRDFSADCCWTILGSDRGRPSRARGCSGMQRQGDTVYLRYGGDIGRALQVRPADKGVAATAFTHLRKPIYSHLNTFCMLRINGHKRLTVSFSPCSETQIEVLPSDYPRGRPARVAYLAEDGGFHIAEAASGEKGPFRDLASGPLKRSEPLAMTFYDEDRAVCSLLLDDWARQAGTALSPTAGWGLPVNAIEMSRLGDAPSETVVFWFTLAGTSIGRGWDSVGHAPGIYRNRFRIHRLAGQTDTSAD